MSKLPPLTTEQICLDIIKKGLAVLASEKGYGQNNVVKKLNVLHYQLSTSSLSNVMNDRRFSFKIVKAASDGIKDIIQKELGMEYSSEKGSFYIAREANWQPYIVPETDKPEQQSAITFHGEGRVPIQYKTDFMNTAQKEVIEFGIRLKTFAGYFTSRSDQEYKEHIIKLLENGVNVKGYLLDPNSQEASMYFEDRKRVEPAEKDAIEDARKVIERLKMLVKELKELCNPGTFEIYTYKHVPYNHFLAVDVDSPDGKMMVSHYIYGISRAKCPVLEFSRTSYPTLYRKYADSLRLYLKDARKLE